MYVFKFLGRSIGTYEDFEWGTEENTICLYRFKSLSPQFDWANGAVTLFINYSTGVVEADFINVIKREVIKEFEFY